MHRIVILAAIFLMGTLLSSVIFSVLVGRRLSAWEIGGVGWCVILLVIAWKWTVRRRSKHRLRNLRDSALW